MAASVDVNCARQLRLQCEHEHTVDVERLALDILEELCPRRRLDLICDSDDTYHRCSPWDHLNTS